MIRVTLHAHPGAHGQAVRPRADGSLDVYVRAPALDGRANAAVLAALAEALALRPRQVQLVRGERSRQKVVELDLASALELAARLAVDEGDGAVTASGRGPRSVQSGATEPVRKA
jgi:uncharacterized protein